MHGFFAFGVVHHVLIALILSFFILFAASKADGLVKLFGNILGVLLLLVAVLGIVFAGMHAMHGGDDQQKGWMGMHGGWDHMMLGHAPPGSGTAPAAPAPASPKKP